MLITFYSGDTMMRKLNSRTVDLLHKKVERLDGDWAAAASELVQFEESVLYRNGLRRDFIEKYDHKPTRRELVRYWIGFTLRRSICFRAFRRGN